VNAIAVRFFGDDKSVESFSRETNLLAITLMAISPFCENGNYFVIP
jgi:hypothetical protein